MFARHVAYGLAVSCSFELPGLRPGIGTGLPAVALERASAAELERSWSGADGRYAWTGTLDGGSTLTIETGRGGDLRFSHTDGARFLLDAGGELLRCAPAHEGADWQRVLLTRVLPDVAIARGYEALHASALDSPHGAVAIAAPSGTGKTTLALELLRRGWSLLADDVVVLGPGASAPQLGPGPSAAQLGPGASAARVLAHPAASVMNVAASTPDVAAVGSTLALLAGERWIAVPAGTREPTPLRVVCLLERERGLALGAQALPASPLPLAPYMLGLLDDAERERRRFALYADLVSETALVRLTADLDAPPAELADLLEETLAGRPLLAAGGVR